MSSDGAWDLQRQQLGLVAGWADLAMPQLWLRYFAIGGDVGPVELEAFLQGLMPLPSLQRDLLAHVVNERLDELTDSYRVPYTRTVRPSPPRSGPLPALVDLLCDAHLAPPDRLAELAARAGSTLGVRVVMYLVDHDQKQLVPAPSSESQGRAPLSIDGTLAGRAFQSSETQSSVVPDEPARLWVPLLDGSERLGVLEMTLAWPADLDDPGLRQQCTWLALLLGRLVPAAGAHGDALDAVRRQRPRSAAAELVWQLLPPPSVRTDAFELSAWLAPASSVGGDVFDYSVSETRATFAILDAMGHGLGAGLIAAAALASLRSARRNGGSLIAQAAAVDVTLAEQFPDDTFATGVLAELDLQTGRLRFVSAGHAPPLVLRAGRLVRTLAGGSRLPFGLGPCDDPAAEERLQPGDWVVLHTDGVTEARSADGQFFGEERLVEFLTRELADDRPADETVRRLARAVTHHQHDVLQDDATVVLVRWQGAPAPLRSQPWHD